MMGIQLIFSALDFPVFWILLIKQRIWKATSTMFSMKAECSFGSELDTSSKSEQHIHFTHSWGSAPCTDTIRSCCIPAGIHSHPEQSSYWTQAALWGCSLAKCHGKTIFPLQNICLSQAASNQKRNRTTEGGTWLEKRWCGKSWRRKGLWQMW